MIAMAAQIAMVFADVLQFARKSGRKLSLAHYDRSTMKTALITLAFAVSSLAQTVHPIAKQNDPKIGSDLISGDAIAFAQSAEPPDLTLVSQMNDGTHTIVITDPKNHWRCTVTSSVPVHPNNVLHSEVSSFTMVCFDTNEIYPAIPPKAK